MENKKKDINYYTYTKGRKCNSCENTNFVPYGEDTSPLVWNVFYYNINSNNFEVYNIFDHCSFYEDICRINKDYKEFDEFAQKVRFSLSYYYWSKCEWEIDLTSHFCDEQKTIDVYTQVMLNWDNFIKYLRDNRDILKSA